MPTNDAIRRITLLSFRTFGDYVLKAPFLYELYRRNPHAEVTVLTNRKGGEVYPLLDSRLRVIVLDHGDSKGKVLTTLRRLPKADVVYAIDDSRTTLVFSLLVRGKRKTGWVQGISRLYAEGGYFEWKSVRPWLSWLVRLTFRPARVRLPEGKYEGDVELELLEPIAGANCDSGACPDGGAPTRVTALCAYRSSFSRPPQARPETPYIYCATEAGWQARQLTGEQWNGIVEGLLQAFPRHLIVVHGNISASGPRVRPYGQKSVQALLETISAADLVIAPDSFALHLSSLYNVPAIGYFGPAHPYRFRPTGPGSSSLFRAPECSPCLQRRGSAVCRKGLAQCSSLAALRPQDFIVAAMGVLASAPVLPDASSWRQAGDGIAAHEHAQEHVWEPPREQRTGRSPEGS